MAAIRFEGDFEVERPRESVYAFLSDPERFAPLLPDYQGLEKPEDGRFTIKLRVGVSQIRGTARFVLELADSRSPQSALYRGKGKLGAGSVDIEAAFKLEEKPPSSTHVHWSGQAQVFGILKALAGGLLEPLARKNIDRLILSLKTALEEGG